MGRPPEFVSGFQMDGDDLFCVVEDRCSGVPSVLTSMGVVDNCPMELPVKLSGKNWSVQAV